MVNASLQVPLPAPHQDPAGHGHEARGKLREVAAHLAVRLCLTELRYLAALSRVDALQPKLVQCVAQLLFLQQAGAVAVVQPEDIPHGGLLSLRQRLQAPREVPGPAAVLVHSCRQIFLLLRPHPLDVREAPLQCREAPGRGLRRLGLRGRLLAALRLGVGEGGPPPCLVAALGAVPLRRGGAALLLAHRPLLLLPQPPVIRPLLARNGPAPGCSLHPGALPRSDVMLPPLDGQCGLQPALLGEPRLEAAAADHLDVREVQLHRGGRRKRGRLAQGPPLQGPAPPSAALCPGHLQRVSRAMLLGPCGLATVALRLGQRWLLGVLGAPDGWQPELLP
mmetsp:Transcript_81407/g.252869  ORF Transcript_81407/g.252869 Transcript_81407/m.252869 type:complete len:336 (+) Transcript_81407:1413-2420(+)